MMRLLIFATVIAVCVGDDYFYNMRDSAANIWKSFKLKPKDFQGVEPVYGQLGKRALYGMTQTPKLTAVLGTDDETLDKMDNKIREMVSRHLQDEFGSILNKMQQLIDIVKSFSLDMVDNLQVAIRSMETGVEYNHIEQAGDIYVNELIRRAKQAITEIIHNLDYQRGERVEDHLSGKVFQSLAVRIAREVLNGAEFTNMEKTVLRQMENALDAVFNDDEKAIESGVMSDVSEDLKKSLRALSPSIQGKEAEFQEWMNLLIKNGVAGAKPQLQLLHGYAKEVISEGCLLCQKVCDKAYRYFEQYKDVMGESWTKIEHIVQLITNEETV